MAWNKPSETKVEIKGGGGQRNVYLKGILVGAVAVVVGVVCIFAFSGKSEKPVKDTGTRPAKIKEVTPAPAPKAVEEPKEEVPKVDPKLAQIRQMVKGMSNEERANLAFKMLQEKPLDLTPTTNRPFRTATELHLARMFTLQLGDRPPPPFPKVPLQDEAHLAEILIANNPVIDGDSEEIQLGKQAVELAKKELREYIKEGGDANTFLDYYYNKINAAFRERTDAMKEVVKVAQDDPDIAGEFYRQVNERLEKKGIKKIEFPEQVKAKLGLED